MGRHPAQQFCKLRDDSRLGGQRRFQLLCSARAQSQQAFFEKSSACAFHRGSEHERAEVLLLMVCGGPQQLKRIRRDAHIETRCAGGFSRHDQLLCAYVVCTTLIRSAPKVKPSHNHLTCKKIKRFLYTFSRHAKRLYMGRTVNVRSRWHFCPKSSTLVCVSRSREVGRLSRIACVSRRSVLSRFGRTSRSRGSRTRQMISLWCTRPIHPPTLPPPF